jgi:hypothetical protein
LNREAFKPFNDATIHDLTLHGWRITVAFVCMVRATANPQASPKVRRAGSTNAACDQGMAEVEEYGLPDLPRESENLQKRVRSLGGKLNPRTTKQAGTVEEDVLQTTSGRYRKEVFPSPTASFFHPTGSPLSSKPGIPIGTRRR